MSVALPKPPGYEYVLFQPELVHMAIASKQILAGIDDPSNAFTPGAFLVAMLCLALGIPQFLDAA
jgi:hypothetical protein